MSKSFSCDDAEKGIWRRGSKQSERDGVWKMERRWKSPVGGSKQRESYVWRFWVLALWHQVKLGVKFNIWDSVWVKAEPCECEANGKVTESWAPYLKPWNVLLSPLGSHENSFIQDVWCQLIIYRNLQGVNVIIRLAGFQPVIDGRWQGLEYSCGTGDWEVGKQWRHWRGRRI